MKKIIVAIMCVLLSMQLLTGCGNRNNSVQTGNDFDVNVNVDTNLSAELKISISAFDSENWILDSLIEGFNKIYPNVKVVKDPIGGDLTTTLMGYWGAGKMPDIFALNNYEMLNLSKAGLILNLKPYIDAETEAGTFDENDYVDAFWKLGQLNFDGDQMMIPRTADQVVTHVNMKVLRDLGVDTSKIKNGWTWADFISVVKEAKSKGLGGVVDSYLNWEAVYNPILESFGSVYFNDDRTSGISSDATVKALDLMKEVYALNGNNYSGGFDGGTAPFMFHSRPASLSISTLKAMYGANWQDDYYDVVTFPIVNPENPKIGAGVSGYAISSTCQNKDIAWKFLKFILSKDGQNCIADAGMNFPSIRKDMADPSNPENHWGVGYEKYNMAAYTWGSVNNCISPTTFILIKPGRSLDLVDSIKVMINNYVCDGYTAQKAMNKCAQTLEYWLDN